MPQRYENLTEVEFLAHQAELAKSAIANSSTQFKEAIKSATDLKAWAHYHPWLSVGVAGAVGFSLAAALKGKKPMPAASVNGSAATKGETSANGAAATAARAGMATPLLAGIFRLAGTVLETTVLTALRTDAFQSQARESAEESRSVPISSKQY
ncbi:MAG: hypothetical protein SGJ20_09800 [Planctomycetota bacterium]|nr:hypothetical protein [Planctomycetota bacterium]